MTFHPEFGTFVTAGSDGTFNFWDKDSKQRLKAQSKCSYSANFPAPITAGESCFAAVTPGACAAVHLQQRYDMFTIAQANTL